MSNLGFQIVYHLLNEDDLDDVPESVRNEMTFHTPTNIDDILDLSLVESTSGDRSPVSIAEVMGDAAQDVA